MELDNRFVLSLIHLIIVVPLFLFVGFQRASTPHWLYLALFATGVVIALYHGFRLMMRIKNRSAYAWVNAIHVLAVAPILLYIGYHKKETPRWTYEVLLMLGFAAAGYHLFSLVRMLQVTNEPSK